MWRWWKDEARERMVHRSRCCLLLAGCSSIQRDTPIQVWDDMKHQQKFKAQAPVVGIFADGRSNRLLPEDTVPRSGIVDDSPYNTGLDKGMYVGKNPVPITPALLEQGQAKFNIYCSPCHDQTGMGRGIIPAHVPIWQPSNLTEDRVVRVRGRRHLQRDHQRPPDHAALPLPSGGGRPLGHHRLRARAAAGRAWYTCRGAAGNRYRSTEIMP